MDNKRQTVVIIGAGPSGLALAYELIQLNSKLKPVLIEKLPVSGGLSRTIYVDNSGIDIGGHRLFTKDKYVESVWKKFLKVQNTPSYDDILAHRNNSYPQIGADPAVERDVLLIRKRFSSIIKNSKKFHYPIKFNMDTFLKLGFCASFKAVASYFHSLFFRRPNDNVENFLINRFGGFIYNLFFKDHSKKIWGIEPSLLINEWGKNRIQKSLFSLPKIWEDEYYYPKFGCSQLWNKMSEYIINNGGKILYNTEFIKFRFADDNIVSAIVECNNQQMDIPAKYFISSIPLCDLIRGFDAPFDIKQHALNLQYRDYILAGFYTNRLNIKNDFKFKTYDNNAPDSWIYLQEEGTRAARLQIMNNWSPYLVNDYKEKFIVSFEYFCNVGDDIWNLADEEIVKLALNDAYKYKFFEYDDVCKTKIIRQEKAYPVYSGSYKHINNIRSYFNKYKNFYIMGRNGEHRYLNMDSAMVCGINIARDINKDYSHEEKLS